MPSFFKASGRDACGLSARWAVIDTPVAGGLLERHRVPSTKPSGPSARPQEAGRTALPAPTRSILPWPQPSISGPAPNRVVQSGTSRAMGSLFRSVGNRQSQGLAPQASWLVRIRGGNEVPGFRNRGYGFVALTRWSIHSFPRPGMTVDRIWGALLRCPRIRPGENTNTRVSSRHSC